MKDITFEKALEKLEKTVEELESGGFPLDEALKRYEQGIKMARLCMKMLDEAKARIEVLNRDQDGNFLINDISDQDNKRKKGKKEND